MRAESWQAGLVDITVADVDHIPPDSIHVPREEFVAFWSAAERLNDGEAQREDSNWYTAGVIVTCRWLAGATVRVAEGGSRIARSPVTKSTRRAYAELVQAEALAAQVLDMQRPVPQWLSRRPGWMAGILATFDWAWWRTGEPPVPASDVAAG